MPPSVPCVEVGKELVVVLVDLEAGRSHPGGGLGDKVAGRVGGRPVVLAPPQPHTAQGHGHAYQAPFQLSPRSSFQNRL